MKKSIPLYAILLSISSLFLSNGFTQDPTQWQLPEGAKTRIGKGAASDITFTPDGTQFAVTTNIGIWIYDAKTGAEITVLKQPWSRLRGNSLLTRWERPRLCNGQ